MPRRKTSSPSADPAKERNARAARIADENPDAFLEAALTTGPGLLARVADGITDSQRADAVRLAAVELDGITGDEVNVTTTPERIDLRPVFGRPIWGWSLENGYIGATMVDATTAAAAGLGTICARMWLFFRSRDPRDRPAVFLPPTPAPTGPALGMADVPLMGDMNGRPLAEVVIERLARVPVGKGVSARTLIAETLPREPYRPVRRVSLPRLHRAGDAVVLPSFSPPKAPDPEPYLPGLDLEDTACPSWLLYLYDHAGGGSLAQGRGAPWDLRLFIAALCAVKVEDRNGVGVPLPFKLEDVGGWLHPDGWTNRRRDWERLPAALNRLGSLRVPIGGMLVAPVHALAVPKAYSADAAVVLMVTIPRAARAGVRLDWDRLRRYGLQSAAIYRAYLSVSAVLDHSAAGGMPITRQIAAPVLNRAGKPIARKGRLLRNPDRLVENPAARYVAVFTDRDAASFIGYDPNDKRRRYDARKAIEQLERDGVIELERLSRGQFRMFGRRP